MIRRNDGSEITVSDFARARRSGEEWRAEEVVIHATGGRSLAALLNATPIRTYKGEVASFAVTLQDMREFSGLDRLRAEFLDMVTCELRTPVAAIKGSATMALKDTTPGNAAEMEQFFHVINQQANHMNGLINDLHDAARIDTCTLKVDPESVSVTDLLDEARNAFLDGRGRNDILIELPPDLPPVMADRRRIVRVLINLLTNATRNSTESTPIGMGAAREETHVRISVADQGRNAPAGRLEHQFRKYQLRKDRKKELDVWDSGMGLAILRGIIEAHGGSIRAVSASRGAGAIFSFTIPISEARVQSENIATVETGGQGNSERPGRETILIVDGDPMMLRKIRRLLSEAGYIPILTGNPATVTALIKKHRPGLVLLDLVLPETDGVELMTDIFEITRVPVVFVSAYRHEHAVARALDAGGADYVAKPFSPTELLARIRAALRTQGAFDPSITHEPFVLDDLTINYEKRTVSVAGRAVRLTDTEYRLLVELSRYRGATLTYELLHERVWSNWQSEDRRTLRATIKNIRRKLGDDAADPRFIFNEPRVGYRLGSAV